MIKRILITALAVLFVAQITKAQSTTREDNKKFKEAVGLFQDEAYGEAIDIFSELLVNDPENINILYNLGFCQLNAQQYEEAIVNLQKIYTGLEGEEKISDLGVDVQMMIGEAEQLLTKPEEAIKTYEELISQLGNEDEPLINGARRQIEICENAIELMAKPVKLEVHNLGADINSKYDDHSPLISADESLLMFTSKRASSYSELLPNGQYAERIYSSVIKDEAWTKAKSSKELFRKPGHEAGVCLSSDETELYIFRNDINGSNLYVSMNDGSNWGEPVKLPAPINSRYNETHASISPDKSTLYFTSNREGGIGGKDIYRVRRLPNGEWGKAENLESLNTPYDDDTPIIHPDGRTLYFSSEGHNSMGKFDIFYTQLLEDDTWTAPTNMGYPINTPDDDFFFVPTATQNIAYYASSGYEDNLGGSDLYLIEYEEPEINRLAVFKGQVTSEGDAPLENVRIFVTKLSTDEAVGEYRPHPGTGNYVLILEAEESYKVRFAGEGYEAVETKVNVEREMAYKKSTKTTTLEPTELTYLLAAKAEDKEAPGQTDMTALDVSDGIPYYTVQILSSKKQLGSFDIFEGLEHNLIKEYDCKDGWFRYAYSIIKGYKSTLKAKQKVLDTEQWQDAFIRDIKQYDDMVKPSETKN
ncbi:tetratricopeptide repeat protein [Carboxylicivirga sp. N1Y90]|uniref:tetratricopeptide repeat protein n=1 Tax=Carboxylicivirga fragile TaxID=3417571 RepID=UPI003D32EB63|nr:PD40 domain-containing protein [Marinilabiliaceae bacterium N1Y90]